MTDDLIKKLPKVGDLTFPMWQDWIMQYDIVLKQQKQIIDYLKREVLEERNSREVAATKAWEFSDRIKELEGAILEIFDYECRTSDRSLIACTARDALWPKKKGDKIDGGK